MLIYILLQCAVSSLKSVQLVQNTAARVLTGSARKDHVFALLVFLRSFPVNCIQTPTYHK